MNNHNNISSFLIDDRISTWYGRRTAPRVAKERYDGEVSTCVNGLVDTSGGGSSRISLAELDEYSRGVSDSTS